MDHHSQRPLTVWNALGAEFLPPREDVNSPDMYIPLMAFVTYILLSTLIAGLNGKFEPQLLGITFSNASIIILLELAVLWLGRYFLNITSESQIYDLIAYSGYKFVGVILQIALAAVFNGGKGTGGWVGWAVFAYTYLANAFFLVSNVRHLIPWSQMLTCKTATQSQICLTALGSPPGKPFNANDCSFAAESEDAVPVCVQLSSPICLHVVAFGAGSGKREDAQGREVMVTCPLFCPADSIRAFKRRSQRRGSISKP